MTAGLKGTLRLIRLILRLERTRLPVWIALLTLVPAGTAASFFELYPSPESREALAATVVSNPTMTAFLGPLHNATVGGLTAWRVGVIGGVLVGIMAVLTTIRHTREDEEFGRRELLGSTVVGRYAPLTAALLVTTGAGAAIGAFQALALAGVGLPATGSIAFGLGFAGIALAFGAIAAVAAQLPATAGAAKGIAIAVLGVCFLLRLAGDTGQVEALTWVSPLGWLGLLRPFAGERWEVLGLWVALGIVLTITAFAIANRRDVGAGVFPPRAGRLRAGASLAGVEGLAWRLHKGSLLGWSAGLITVGLVYGGVADGIGGFLTESPQLAQIFEALGGDRGITDAFFSAATGIMALIASAYAIRSVLRLQVEEELLRSEVVLGTATSRRRWASAHLLFAIVGPALMLVAAGAVAGAAYGAVIDDVGSQALRVAVAALVNVPAIWVIAGFAMLLYGALPRRVSWSWGVLVLCLLLGQLGRILQFPQWALNLSPFSHVPLYPVADVSPLPILILTGLAGVFLTVGLAGFHRRDIPAV
jgi:ABC-2 type transport system permease protein